MIGIRSSIPRLMKMKMRERRKMSTQKEKRTIGILGVPLDIGAGKRGVDLGTRALREAGIRKGLEQLGFKVVDYGDIEVPNTWTGEISEEDATCRYNSTIFKVLSALADKTEYICSQGHLPLTIGGDHTVGAGSMAGVQRYRRKAGLEPCGLLWVDAHTDMNTPETSPSGNMHGMPVAALLGLKVK